jgi:hypothetical protein
MKIGKCSARPSPSFWPLFFDLLFCLFTLVQLCRNKQYKGKNENNKRQLKLDESFSIYRDSLFILPIVLPLSPSSLIEFENTLPAITIWPGPAKSSISSSRRKSHEYHSQLCISVVKSTKPASYNAPNELPSTFSHSDTSRL